tara:strand:+ start:1696 stop:2004 length:309 start_codon:yes stop_codon:yes gene_type:complete
LAHRLQITLIVSNLFLDICFCCECSRSDNTKLGKKVEDIENLVMELEIEASNKAELSVALEELNANFDTISKFKKDVAKFLVVTDRLDKTLVDPPALPFCID